MNTQAEKEVEFLSGVNELYAFYRCSSCLIGSAVEVIPGDVIDPPKCSCGHVHSDLLGVVRLPQQLQLVPLNQLQGYSSL
jgi:hypothetical protein